jgi:hypothetical protein
LTHLAQLWLKMQVQIITNKGSKIYWESYVTKSLVNNYMYISARICMQLIVEVMKLTTQKLIIIMNRPKRCTTICLWKRCPYLCHGQRALQFCARGFSRLRWNGDDESQMALFSVLLANPARWTSEYPIMLALLCRVYSSLNIWTVYVYRTYVLAKMHAISILISVHMCMWRVTI